ncbi:hypothetical protein [Aliarcobacter butzleri]|uniref:hypothetical protein n=1 Tax=Aliarcobacter butzleri TaxID=28197 RepID=UPI003AFB104A
MKKMVIFALPILGAIMFSGCATILGGGNQQTISINSDKPMKGKLVYEDGKGEQYFTTPATVNVDRRSKDIILSSDNDEFSTKLKNQMLMLVLGKYFNWWFIRFNYRYGRWCCLEV